MFIPVSTYRVQLHKDFNFADLESVLDYLQALGVTTIYAAPILKAKAGSMHGYDVVDPHQINPEIGTLAQFRKLIHNVRERHMTWVQDIVPNHMAFDVSNERLMDVMERGQNSPYADYFDIIWDHSSPSLTGKLQVPFLGKPLQDCIRDEEITLDFTPRGFTVNYFETEYPLSVSALSVITKYIPDIAELKIADGAELSLADWRTEKNRWVDALLDNSELFQCIHERLFKINRHPAILEEILEAQSYSLTYWKESEKTIGYRRFFTVNELICLRMEDETVFDEYHRFIHELYKEGLIQGIRIDHIDGLKDPLTYLNRLRNLFGKDCYIIAEKILETREEIPHHWPIEGTSGYEFLSYVNQLVTNRKGAKQLVSFYRDLVPQIRPYKELVTQNKWLILENYMAGEWDNLLGLLYDLLKPENFSRDQMKMALGWLMVSMPVYRIYPDQIPLVGEDREVMQQAFQKALIGGKDCQPELEYLKLVLLENAAADNEAVLKFTQRLMQFTGPLTAKGVEDTTFYVYNALISHDEVGDAPSSLGISITDFHRKMVLRKQGTPWSLNTTATHDTKRGEDARIRLNVLCDFPELWEAVVRKWLQVNMTFKSRTASGALAPTVNDEYYIYQSIVGGFPEDFIVTDSFVERMIAYQTKVVREAKVNSNWSDPDVAYEEGCHSFIRSILTPGSHFLQELVPFLQTITTLANRYSVAQTLVKITAPGIPDTYQGGGLWDLSFVDPDNRRPVDYVKRYEFLTQLQERWDNNDDSLFAYIEDHRQEGIEKLFVTWKALSLRKEYPDVFLNGDYIPLQITGSETVTVAFARRHKNQWVLVVAPLRVRDKKDQTDLAADDELILPETAPGLWTNVFTGEVLQNTQRIRLGDLFDRFPMALLVGES